MTKQLFVQIFLRSLYIRLASEDASLQHYTPSPCYYNHTSASAHLCPRSSMKGKQFNHVRALPEVKERKYNDRKGLLMFSLLYGFWSLPL